MSLIRNSNQRKFLDIYPNESDFILDINGSYSIFKPDDITDESIKKTYWMIVARYGDQAINGYSDEGRWKLRLFETIDTYGPTWQKKLEIQKEIRALTLPKLKETGKLINNTALNPNNEPTTDELDYISQQNTSKTTMSDADALNLQYMSLNDGINREYMDHFAFLFSKFLLTDVPLYLYQNEEYK